MPPAGGRRAARRRNAALARTPPAIRVSEKISFQRL